MMGQINWIQTLSNYLWKYRDFKWGQCFSPSSCMYYYWVISLSPPERFPYVSDHPCVKNELLGHQKSSFGHQTGHSQVRPGSKWDNIWSTQQHVAKCFIGSSHYLNVTGLDPLCSYPGCTVKIFFPLKSWSRVDLLAVILSGLQVRKMSCYIKVVIWRHPCVVVLLSFKKKKENLWEQWHTVQPPPCNVFKSNSTQQQCPCACVYVCFQTTGEVGFLGESFFLIQTDKTQKAFRYSLFLRPVNIVRASARPASQSIALLSTPPYKDYHTDFHWSNT